MTLELSDDGGTLDVNRGKETPAMPNTETFGLSEPPAPELTVEPEGGGGLSGLAIGAIAVGTALLIGTALGLRCRRATPRNFLRTRSSWAIPRSRRHPTALPNETEVDEVARARRESTLVARRRSGTMRRGDGRGAAGLGRNRLGSSLRSRDGASARRSGRRSAAPRRRSEELFRRHWRGLTAPPTRSSTMAPLREDIAQEAFIAPCEPSTGSTGAARSGRGCIGSS